MSELKDKLTKEVSEIDKIISNPEEKAKVLSVIQEMIGDFTKHIVHLTERQNEMEERMDEVYNMLSDIEAELVACLAEDMHAECPYCGEIIPLELNDGEFSDFECPKCHNVIEMEMMFEEHECDCGECGHDSFDDDDFEDCGGNCGHCSGCSSEEEEEE